MAITVSSAAHTAGANAYLDQVTALFNAGAGPGVLEIRTGSKPASVADAATGTLLATVTLADPAFGAASGKTATGTDPASVNAVATGTAGWFRGKDSTGTAVIDGTVTATGGGGDMELSSTTVTATYAVYITALSLSVP